MKCIWMTPPKLSTRFQPRLHVTALGIYRSQSGYSVQKIKMKIRRAMSEMKYKK